MKKLEIISEGQNYCAANLGDLNQLEEYATVNPITGEEFPGKIFLGEKLKLSGMEVSFHIAHPNSGLPFLHKHHKNEELYIILQGSGEFYVDAKTFAIKEGSIIRVATPGARSWKNTSNAPMIVMTVQAVEGSLKGFNTSDGYMDREV